MTPPAKLSYFSLAEILGLAQFLFGVERINDVPRTLDEWMAIINFCKQYCRPRFPRPGIWLPDNPGFWKRFLELRDTKSSQKTLLQPGSPPDTTELEFITRISSTYTLLCLAQKHGDSDVDEVRFPIITLESELSITRKASKEGEKIHALDLPKNWNSVVCLCNRWHIAHCPA